MMACDGGVRRGGCGDGHVELGFVLWCGVSHSLQPLYTIKNKLVLKKTHQTFVWAHFSSAAAVCVVVVLVVVMEDVIMGSTLSPNPVKVPEDDMKSSPR